MANPFKSPAPAQAAPVAPPDPIRIPGPNDPDIMAGRRAKTADEFDKRKGRDSTRLVTGGDASYSRTTLG